MAVGLVGGLPGLGVVGVPLGVGAPEAAWAGKEGGPCTWCGDRSCEMESGEIGAGAEGLVGLTVVVRCGS